MTITLHLALIGHDFGSEQSEGGYEDWVLTRGFDKRKFEGFHVEPEKLLESGGAGFLARNLQSQLYISITVAGRDKFNRLIARYRQYCYLSAGFAAESEIKSALDSSLNPSCYQPPSDHEARVSGPVLIEPILLHDVTQVGNNLQSRIQFVVETNDALLVRDRFLQLAVRAAEGMSISILSVKPDKYDQLTISEQEFVRLVEEKILTPSTSEPSHKVEQISSSQEPVDSGATASDLVEADNGIECEHQEASQAGAASFDSAAIDLSQKTAAADPRAEDVVRLINVLPNSTSAEERKVGRIGTGYFSTYRRNIEALTQNGHRIWEISRRTHTAKGREHLAIMECLDQARVVLSSHTLGETSFVLHERYFRICVEFHYYYAKSDLASIMTSDKENLSSFIRDQCPDRIELETEGLAAFWRWLRPFGCGKEEFDAMLQEYCIAVFSGLLRREFTS